MKVAVVGAGYAGLAVAWFLLKKNYSVTLFDGGMGASHASTGLLHDSPGKNAKLTWRAKEGIEATLELLKIAGSDTFTQSGILRFAANDEQRKLFGGNELWNPEGITVFSKKYLQGLKKACYKAKIIQHWVQNLEELKEFDRIIFTTGSDTLTWASLPLKKTIGQCLVCQHDEPLSYSLLSEGHITVTEDPGICLVGSTYEHTEKPDPQKALSLIDQVAKFYPKAKAFKVLEILSGVRIAPKVGYKPIIEKIGDNTWVFTGLGSRGLIYHSLLASAFVDQLQ